MILGDKDYVVKELSPQQISYYKMKIDDWARADNNHLPGFVKKINGLPNQDILIQAFLNTDWTKPTELETRKVQTSIKGVMLLCTLMLGVKYNDLIGLVTEDNHFDVYKKLCSVNQPPSIEDILTFNAKMKEKILCQLPQMVAISQAGGG